MLRRLQTLLWISLVLLIGGWNDVFAAVGVLKLQRGEIKVSSHGVVTVLTQPGTTIEVDEGAKITSAKLSRGQLFLNNKSESVEIYSLTYLNLKSIQPNASQISFPIGKAKFSVKHRPGLSFKVRTASALVGVKGTEFLVQSIGSQTQVLTLDGVVTLASVSNPDIEVEIGKNKASSTSKTGVPAKPVTVSKDNQQKMLQKDDAQEESFIPSGDSAPSTEDSQTTGETSEPQGDESPSMDMDAVLNQLADQQDQLGQVQEDVDDTISGDTKATFTITK